MLNRLVLAGVAIAVFSVSVLATAQVKIGLMVSATGTRARLA